MDINDSRFWRNDPSKIPTDRFSAIMVASMKEKYNRYADGSFGGARKRKYKKLSL